MKSLRQFITEFNLLDHLDGVKFTTKKDLKVQVPKGKGNRAGRPVSLGGKFVLSQEVSYTTKIVSPTQADIVESGSGKIVASLKVNDLSDFFNDYESNLERTEEE